MQSGVISPDNVADILRGISQRRRQGLLEIRTHKETLEIKFVQGRVVEASRSDRTGVQETVEWLLRAGYPCREAEDYADLSYAELFATLEAELPNEMVPSVEELVEVVRQRILEHLYSMEVGGGAFYTFKVQMVDFDRTYAPNISIGQVLLDLVELQSEKEEFEANFPPGTVVRLTGASAGGLAAEETRVVQAIGSACEIRELERRALLSSFHFRHAVLELAHAAILSHGGKTSPVVESSSATELESFLNDSIDTAFSAIPETEPHQEPTSDEYSEEEVDQSESLVGLIQDDDGPSHQETTRKITAFSSANARLLQNVWIPSIIAFTFLLLAIAAPLVAWRHLIAAFVEM